MFTDLSFIILLFFSLAVLSILFLFLITREKIKERGETEKSKLFAFDSKENVVSQWFLLLGTCFFGVTLLILNRDMGEPIEKTGIILVTALVGFCVAYYFGVISTLILSLFGMISWWGIQGLNWTHGKDIGGLVILTGSIFLILLYYVCGYLHKKKSRYKDFGFIYTVLGILSITGALFLFSSKPGLESLASMIGKSSIFASWEITVSLLIFFFSLLGITGYALSKRAILLFEGIAVIFIAILFGVILFLPQQSMVLPYGELSNTGFFWAIIFNLAVFFEVLGLILSGYVRRQEWLVNMGTFFLFTLIFIKYFDWFFTFFDKSIFFLGAGFLLFGIGWFMERSRKYMIGTMKSE